MARVQMFLGVDISDAEKAFKRLSRKMKRFGRQAEATGRVLTKALTVPIVAVGAASTKAGIDFESAFAGVRKTVKGTEEDFSKLSRGIRDMSKKMPASAASIAKVAESAGQLGIEKDNILGFSKTMIELGDSTNMLAEEGAKALAKFANVTGMSQKDFDRLGSTIVDLGNNMATTEADIVDMASRLAGAGKQIKLTQAEIMGLAAGLSSVGLNAEAGGTAFSKVMAKMQLAVETNSDQLIQFANIAGMTSRQFKQAFKDDASEAILDFLEGLSKTEEQGVSAIKVLNDMGLTEARLRDALLRASSASGVMRKAVDLGTKAWGENVALTKEAAERYKTTASKLKIMKNNITDMFIDLSDPILDLIHEDLPALQDKIQGLSRYIATMSTDSKNNLLKISTTLAIGGPMLIAVNAAIGVFKAFGTVLIGLATGPAAPLVEVALAIGAITIAFGELKEKMSGGWFSDEIKNVDKGMATLQAISMFKERHGRRPRGLADQKEVDDIINDLMKKYDKLIKKKEEVITLPPLKVEGEAVGDEEPPVKPIIPTFDPAGAKKPEFTGMTTAESTAADIARIQAVKDAQLEATEAAQQGVAKFWSDMSWEADQGLITNQEYFGMLKTDIGELTQGSDEWKRRFAELQTVAGSLAGQKLEGLKTALDNGKLTTEEWKVKVEELKQKFAELPNVQKKLDSALTSNDNKIKELDTSTALWADNLSKGLADAIVNGESLGDVLSNIGKQLASSMLQKLILGGLTGGGGLGSLFGMHTGGIVGEDHSLVRHIPKMHNGGIVGADEQMTILQKGETVLPRGEEAGATNITMNISATDAPSFMRLLQGNKATVESIVVGSLMSNGNVRKAIQGAM